MTAADAIDLLRQHGQTLATAESLTGGLLGSLVTAVPGASEVYLGGVVSYATVVKRDLLGVNADLIVAHGVISKECADAMAAGVRDLLGADWALSTTGVAGPDPQEDHPVGTVYIALCGPTATLTRLLTLDGDRAAIRQDTCQAALALLIEAVGEIGSFCSPGEEVSPGW